MTLIDKVRKTIKRNALFAPGDRVVVAVSGGPDSVCLLQVLRELSPELRVDLRIAHLDHGFRAGESAEEARFVEKLAHAMGIPATVGHRDVPAYCASRGLSAQAGAREIRYAFLEQAAQDGGAQRIAVGHTANDQAETLLLRLLRGAGLSGLSGMPVRRDRIVRPLIDATRPEVLSFLAERKLEFVNDSSNSKTVYTRNRVRIELLPVLERFNPRIVETLASEAALLRDDQAALESAAGILLKDIVAQDGPGTVRIDRAGLLDLPPPIRRAALLRAIGWLAPEAGLSFVRTEETLGFLQHARTGRRMDLPGGLTLEREYAFFIVRTVAEPVLFDRELAVPGTTVVPELGMEVSVEIRKTSDKSADFENYLWQAAFDYAKISLPLRLRNRLPGDTLRPAGMRGGRKKVQDLFVDEKVPRRLRDGVPLLVSGENVLWIAGIRTDEQFLTGPDTEQVLVATIRNAPSGTRDRE